MLEAEMTAIGNATASELISMYWAGLLNDKEKLDRAFEMLVNHYEELGSDVCAKCDTWED